MSKDFLGTEPKLIMTCYWKYFSFHRFSTALSNCSFNFT